MSNQKSIKPSVVVLIAVVVGAIGAVVLGVLTSGVQATAGPHGVPLAIAAPQHGPAAQATAPITGKITAQGGEQITWRQASPDQARRLLDDKEVYGVLELAPAPDGKGITPKVVVSGAVNPSGTQLAQQLLSKAGESINVAAAQQGARIAPVEVDTVHPASAAARSAPSTVSTLSWIGGLAAGAVFALLAGRGGRRAGAGSRLLLLTGVSVAVTGAIAGLLKLWDGSLPLGADVLGFMLLTAAAFAALQGALFRLMGVRAMSLLAPFYLMAPAVTAQVPEMLNPAYRTLLWSWTPFRFSAEGLRSLLQGLPDAPDVRLALWVLGAMLLAGLVVLVWPGKKVAPELESGAPRDESSATQETQPNPANRVVTVGVD